MGLELHRHRIGYVFGTPRSPRVVNPNATNVTIVGLLKGWLATYPLQSADPPAPDLPTFRMRIPQNAIGGPADPRATSTTNKWTMVSLLKGILNELS